LKKVLAVVASGVALQKPPSSVLRSSSTTGITAAIRFDCELV
jgi:hypothetical protein